MRGDFPMPFTDQEKERARRECSYCGATLPTIVRLSDVQFCDQRCSERFAEAVGRGM